MQKKGESGRTPLSHLQEVWYNVRVSNEQCALSQTACRMLA